MKLVRKRKLNDTFCVGCVTFNPGFNFRLTPKQRHVQGRTSQMIDSSKFDTKWTFVWMNECLVRTPYACMNAWAWACVHVMEKLSVCCVTYVESHIVLAAFQPDVSMRPTDEILWDVFCVVGMMNVSRWAYCFICGFRCYFCGAPKYETRGHTKS